MSALEDFSLKGHLMTLIEILLVVLIIAVAVALLR